MEQGEIECDYHLSDDTTYDFVFVQKFLGDIFADRGMKKETVMIKVTLHQLNTKTSTLLIHCSNLQIAITLPLFGYRAMLKV